MADEPTSLGPEDVEVAKIELRPAARAPLSPDPRFLVVDSDPTDPAHRKLEDNDPQDPII